MSSPLNNRNVHGVGIATTDATQTIAATISTVTDRAYVVEAVILAVETDDHNETASYGRVGTFQNDGGTLTQVGSTTSLWTNETTAGWDVVFAVSGTDIQIKVTGAAVTNVAWLVDATIKNLGSIMVSLTSHADGGIIGEDA